MNFYDPKALVWKWTANLGGIASRVMGWPGLESGKGPVKTVSSGGGRDAAVLGRPGLQCVSAPCVSESAAGAHSKAYGLQHWCAQPRFPEERRLLRRLLFCDQENSWSPWNRRLHLRAI